MEKNFAMLRVTEEKERNFEKRGYMGKKVLGIMVILLFFTCLLYTSKISGQYKDENNIPVRSNLAEVNGISL